MYTNRNNNINSAFHNKTGLTFSGKSGFDYLSSTTKITNTVYGTE